MSELLLVLIAVALSAFYLKHTLDEVNILAEKRKAKRLEEESDE